ncbi:MAG: hypothetical protein FWH33_10745 [Oscillospiraceae bacterium]|nr:hypothetical protein [Oscillospiraceae bacterium]
MNIVDDAFPMVRTTTVSSFVAKRSVLRHHILSPRPFPRKWRELEQSSCYSQSAAVRQRRVFFHNTNAMALGKLKGGATTHFAALTRLDMPRAG